MSWQIFYHQRHATSCEIFLGSGVRSGQDALKAINFPRFKTLLLSHLLHRQKNGKVMSISLMIISLTISSLTLRGYLRSVSSFGSG